MSGDVHETCVQNRDKQNVRTAELLCICSLHNGVNDVYKTSPPFLSKPLSHFSFKKQIFSFNVLKSIEMLVHACWTRDPAFGSCSVLPHSQSIFMQFIIFCFLKKPLKSYFQFSKLPSSSLSSLVIATYHI